MSVNDAVNEYRKRLVRVIERSPNKRAACREAGIHHSTFYRWRKVTVAESQVPRVGRRLSWTEQMIESRIVAAALAYPALGPQGVADELANDELMVSPSKVWRTLRRHRLNTKALRYLLLRVHRDGAPPMREPIKAWIGELDATVPGDLVQMDCFHVGSFKETRLGAGKAQRGHIWQYTAIDVASSWTWAELWATGHNPSAAITSQLAHRVAADLTTWGWDWRAVTTDNGNEYRAQQFGDTMTELGVEHRFIRAGRPQTNGKVERVQGTILQECYQPALLNYTTPSITGLRRDLEDYLIHYNWKRAHRGKWNQGRTPAAIIIPDTKFTP
jgi:transposase InsO family protein